jgi:hypothetical protein
MLRLDSGLWKRISDRVAGTSTTPRQDIERRLRESLAQPDERKLSPARALARVVEMHADDVASYCPTAEAWQAEMRAGIPTLLAELFAEQVPPTNSSGDVFAVTFAKTLAQKIRKAHLSTTRAGGDTWAGQADVASEEIQPSLRHPDEFQRLQEALHLLPEGAKIPRAAAGLKSARMPKSGK